MRKPRALLSLHDVTPAYEGQIRRAWSSLRRWGISSAVPPALLVVPRYHDRYPLGEHPTFVSWLEGVRESGAEILLHGLTHQAPRDLPGPKGLIEGAKARLLTADEGEFQSLPYYRAARALREGLEILDDVLGLRPEGFVAPAWLESGHTSKALESLGFGFHEDHLFVYDLCRGRRLLAPAITFTGRSRPRAIASIGWARAMSAVVRAPVDVRLALHPADFDHDDLVAAIGRLVSQISRQRDWITYRQLLDSPLAVVNHDPLGC